MLGMQEHDAYKNFLENDLSELKNNPPLPNDIYIEMWSMRDRIEAIIESHQDNTEQGPRRYSQSRQKEIEDMIEGILNSGVSPSELECLADLVCWVKLYTSNRNLKITDQVKNFLVKAMENEIFLMTLHQFAEKTSMLDVLYLCLKNKLKLKDSVEETCKELYILLKNHGAIMKEPLEDFIKSVLIPSIKAGNPDAFIWDYRMVETFLEQSKLVLGEEDALNIPSECWPQLNVFLQVISREPKITQESFDRCFKGALEPIAGSQALSALLMARHEPKLNLEAIPNSLKPLFFHVLSRP